ncbi:MAG TPA: MFS transporter [Opitutaceae bacterium]|nr:MFS transporter [Opitutaceae bacterium]
MSASASATSSPSPVPRTSLGVIFLTLYLDLIGFSIFFPVAPALLDHYVRHEAGGGFLGGLVTRLQALAASLGATDLATGALFGGALGSVYALMQFVFSPVWGARSDRAGRRPVLLLTIAGSALSYLLLFFSGSFLVFFAGRILGGIMGGNLAVAIAAVSDVTSRENRAKGMGLVGAAFGLGFLTGPLLGGLTAHLNLLDRWPGLATWGVHPFSVPAAIAFGLCLVNLAWVQVSFRETLAPDHRGPGLTLRDRNPFHALFALPDRAIRRTNLIGFVVTFGFSFFETTISFFTADALGYTPRELTLVFVTLGLGSILTQGVLVRRVVPRIGEKAAAVGGMALIAVAFAGIGLTVGVLKSTPLFFASLALCALGSGFANVGLSALVSLYAPAEEQGKVMGIYRSLGFLARALSPAVAGILYFTIHGTRTYAFSALILLVPVALALALPPPRK